MSKPKKKLDITIYAKDGSTLYNVMEYSNLMKLFYASIPYVMELIKNKMLPHKAFVETHDLIALNKMIFNKDRCVKIELYMDNHKDAPCVISIEDKKFAPVELFLPKDKNVEVVEKPTLKIVRR